jgi:hypothetical protein
MVWLLKSPPPLFKSGLVAKVAGLFFASPRANFGRLLTARGGGLDNPKMQFLNAIPLTLQTVLLLVVSNVFMTFAWYGHLKNLAMSPWYIAALVSWAIALFEYLLQVPANRIGFQQAGITVAQLKIMQEVITLGVFVPFAMFYMDQPLKLDYLWAGLCLMGAVYFIFRSA